MADSKVQPELVELSDDFPFTGDVSGTVADGSITDVKVSDMAASKLTGALPAISGAALTNLPSTYTKSANDPATNTNSAVGALWVNQVSGETYVCTDATTDANVWTNVGSGDGNITPYLPGSFGGQGGGQNYGYHVGGFYPGTTTIQGRYSFTADGNSTSVTSLTRAAYAGCGCQSPTAGYAFGMDYAPQQGLGQRVMKHIFASQNQSEVGGGADLSSWHLQGCTTTNSLTHAYTIGGSPYGSGSSHANYGGVQKMSFATESTMTFVGTAYNDNGAQDPAMTFGSGHSSLTHGYRAGGGNQQQTDKIEKWPFATDADSAFVATLARGVDTGITGASSEYHGYLMGGDQQGTDDTAIDKFSFVSDSNSTDVGDLHTGEGFSSGTSSQTHGYMAGGGHPQINNIQKVSFTTDGNATDVGDIIQARAYLAGYHN